MTISKNTRLWILLWFDVILTYYTHRCESQSKPANPTLIKLILLENAGYPDSSVISILWASDQCVLLCLSNFYITFLFIRFQRNMRLSSFSSEAHGYVMLSHPQQLWELHTHIITWYPIHNRLLLLMKCAPWLNNITHTTLMSSFLWHCK